MDKSSYFASMRRISDVTDRLIIDEIERRYGGNRDLCTLVSDLPGKRAASGRPKLRPALLAWSYEAAGGSDFMQYQDIAAAVEALNLSAYVLNYVLDDKGGEKPKRQRNNECIAAMMLREVAQGLLQRGLARNVPLEDCLDISQRFSEINHSTSGVGQYSDGNALRAVDADFLSTYEHRCEGLTGVFLQNIAGIGGVLAQTDAAARIRRSDSSPDEKERDMRRRGIGDIHALEEYGRNLGIVVQIVNDLGDFVPAAAGKQSVGKVYQDQYSDLRHGCITFPANHVLTHGASQEREAVLRVHGHLDAAEQDCYAVTRAFVRLDGIRSVRTLARAYAKRARDALRTLPQSNAQDYLSMALSMYRTNKFYAALQTPAQASPEMRM